MVIHNKKKQSLFMVFIWPIIISIVLLTVALSAEAQLVNPLSSDTMAEFIKEVANIVMQLGGVVAVIFIIWSGFLFVTARGSEEQLKKAKSTFTWTIIGAMILLGAYVIATAVVGFVTSL